MRLMINGGDWNTVAYISKLQRNEYTDWFFRGYEDHPRATRRVRVRYPTP